DIGGRAKRLSRGVGAAPFYCFFLRTRDSEIPADTGDFRLISRRVIETLAQMPERQRFLRGMIAWLGFVQVAFPYDRDERFSGKTKYPFRKMLRFSIDAFTAFSIAPLRLATLLALIALMVSILLAFYIAIGLLSGRVVQGWASVMTVVIFFGSVQLLVLGVVGEYVGRLMMESERRPLYLVDAVLRKGDVLRIGRTSDGARKNG